MWELEIIGNQQYICKCYKYSCSTRLHQCIILNSFFFLAGEYKPTIIGVLTSYSTSSIVIYFYSLTLHFKICPTIPTLGFQELSSFLLSLLIAPSSRSHFTQTKIRTSSLVGRSTGEKHKKGLKTVNNVKSSITTRSRLRIDFLRKTASQEKKKSQIKRLPILSHSYQRTSSFSCMQ